MAKLDKLLISGIRSFGPHEDDVQQLKFLSPLTLILGQNGCGKTTIIEAIRYACTGCLPSGTTSGQGFVNDPKMSNKPSTKGQIKLKFTAANGDEITVIRIVEVVSKLRGLQFSAKSHSIRCRTPNKEEIDLSNRCADIGFECCQRLNVSSAVLNYVIFCHQENSAWPLDENKKVKETFDQIFDAQKYNKCTDLLRDLEKNKHNQIKIMKEQLEMLKVKKQYVDKQKSTLESKEAKMVSIMEDIEDRKTKQEPMRKRLLEIDEFEQQLNDIQNQIKSKEGEQKGVIEQKQSIINNSSFKEFQGTDKDLDEEINNMDENKNRDKNVIKDLENKKNEIDSQINVISKNIEDSRCKIGKLEQKKLQYERKCQERHLLFEKAQIEIITDSDNCNFNSEPHKIINELKKVLKNHEMLFKNLEKKHQLKEEELQKDIDVIREKEITANQNIASKQSEIFKNDKNIKEITNEIKNANVSDELLKRITSELKKIENDILELKKSFNEKDEEDNWNKIKEQIQKQANELTKLESEYKILQQNHVIESQIALKKQSIEEKTKDIEIIKEKHSNNLNRLFGENIPERNLKQHVDELFNKNNAILKDLTGKLKQCENAITTLEAKKENQIKLIENAKNDLERKEKAIYQQCKGKEFLEIVNESYKRKEKLQKDRGFFRSGKLIYEKFLEEFAQDTPCCPICSTKFDKKHNLIAEIKRNIKTKIESIPEKLEATEKQLKEEEEIYDKLQQLKTINTEVEMLKSSKLPSFENELKTINDNLKIQNDNLIDLKKKLELPEKIVEITQNIIPDIVAMEQDQNYVENAKEMIINLKEQIFDVPSQKTRDQVETEIDQLKIQLNENRNKESRLSKRISLNKDKMQKLLQDHSCKLSRQIDIEKSVKNLPILETQKLQLESQNNQLSDDIKNIKNQLHSIEISLSNAIENREQTLKQNKKIIEKERDKLTLYTNILNEIEKIQKEIESFSINEIENELKSIEINLEQFNIQKQTLEKTKNRITELISEKKQEIAGCEMKFRILQDNKLLREILKRLDKLNSEINDLKKQFNSFNYKNILREKREITEKFELLQKDIDMMAGQKEELSITINQFKEELNKPECKQAYKNYMRKYYELKITEHAEKDIQKYYRALENALLEFHEKRMKEINKTIKEYWHDTYRGNDIDYIEIKSEKATSQTARRSYNYRVVQVKNGIELDMRGRCSAGQRVLACLIIRLAIAETLSAHCGILALDEPTTNLDRENIQSLSETLSRIVSAREQQRNFQLIIITHDEEFLKTITRMRGIPYFYKVSRNNNGFSVIKKEIIL